MPSSSLELRQAPLEWSREIGNMPDRAEELLPKVTGAEPAKVYLAEIATARAQLADMGRRAAKDRAGNEHR